MFRAFPLFGNGTRIRIPLFLHGTLAPRSRHLVWLRSLSCWYTPVRSSEEFLERMNSVFNRKSVNSTFKSVWPDAQGKICFQRFEPSPVCLSGSTYSRWKVEHEEKKKIGRIFFIILNISNYDIEPRIYSLCLVTKVIMGLWHVLWGACRSNFLNFD